MAKNNRNRAPRHATPRPAQRHVANQVVADRSGHGTSIVRATPHFERLNDRAIANNDSLRLLHDRLTAVADRLFGENSPAAGDGKQELVTGAIGRLDNNLDVTGNLSRLIADQVERLESL